MWDHDSLGARFFLNGDSWWVRLERALVTPKWYSQFANVKLYHLTTTTCLLFDGVTVRNDVTPVQSCSGSKQCSFMILDVQKWSVVLRNGLCMSIGHPLQNYISSCKDHLTQWNKKKFSHVGRQISTFQKQFQSLEASPKNNLDEIHRV